MSGSFSHAYSQDFDVFNPLLRTDLFSLLQDVDATVYEYIPAADAPLPLVIYQISDPQEDFNLTGPTGVISYVVTIEWWCNTEVRQKLLNDQIKSRLNGVRFQSIKLMKLVGGNYSQTEDESGEPCYVAQQIYKTIAGEL